MRKPTGSVIRRAIACLLCTAVVVAGGCSDEPEKRPTAPSPPVIPTNGLLAFYPFNGDALDASGNDNNATLLGGASVGSYLTLGNNAVDRCSLPYLIAEGLGDFTISVWARIGGTLHVSGGAHFIISGARGGTDNVLLVGYAPDIRCWTLAINDAGYNFAQNAVIENFDWHHVAAVRNGGKARLYIDGKQVGDEINVTVAALNVDPGGFLLGQDQDSVGGGFQAFQSWAGDLDNLRIYNRALDSRDIQALYLETGWGD